MVNMRSKTRTSAIIINVYLTYSTKLVGTTSHTHSYNFLDGKHFYVVDLVIEATVKRA